MTNVIDGRLFLQPMAVARHAGRRRLTRAGRGPPSFGGPAAGPVGLSPASWDVAIDGRPAPPTASAPGPTIARLCNAAARRERPRRGSPPAAHRDGSG